MNRKRSESQFSESKNEQNKTNHPANSNSENSTIL